MTKRLSREIMSVHWCFFHTRREWADLACAFSTRWTLPDGTPLLQLARAA